MQPFWCARSLENLCQAVLYPEQSVCQPLGRVIRTGNGQPEYAQEQQQHQRYTGAFTGQNPVQFPIPIVAVLPAADYVAADFLCTGHNG